MGPRKNHIGSQRCSLRQTISRLVESARLTNKIQSHVCPAGDNQESRDGRRRGRDWNAVKRGQNKQGNCILGEVDSSNIHAQRETTRYRGSDSKHRTRFRPIEHIEDLMKCVPGCDKGTFSVKLKLPLEVSWNPMNMSSNITSTWPMTTLSAGLGKPEPLTRTLVPSGPLDGVRVTTGGGNSVTVPSVRLLSAGVGSLARNTVADIV